MRVLVVALLVLSIFVSYAIPTFYEAYIEHTVLKTSRQIALDLLWARRLSIRTGKTYGAVFVKGDNPKYHLFLDSNQNNKFDSDDFIVKTVYLKDISQNIKYSSLFDDKNVVMPENTVLFSVVPANAEPNAAGDSIFIINSKDESKGVVDRINRIYVNRTNNDIKILRVVGKESNGDLIFGDIK